MVARETLGGIEVLSTRHNQNIQRGQRIAHAELVALGKCRLVSSQAEDQSRLSPQSSNLILVSTLEPCIMCFSAAIVSGISTVIFAMSSPADAGPGRVQMIEKASAVMPALIGGVLESESRQLFEQWTSTNKPGARHWEYITQLLAMNGPP